MPIIAQVPARVVRWKPRCVRPSVLDRQLHGRSVDRIAQEGAATLCLANFPVSLIELLPFDLPSFNNTLNQMRLWLRKRGQDD